MKLSKLGGFALVAGLIAAVVLFSVHPAAAAPAFAEAVQGFSTLKPYAAIVLAVGLEPLRAQYAEAKAAADAKMAEMKDGLAADAVAKIETEHAALMADVSTVATALAAEERKPHAGKAWAAGFYASAGASGLSLAELNGIVATSASHEDAKDALITAMAKTRNENKPGPSGNAIVTADARDKFVEGATRALMAQTTILSGEANAERNEFTGRSLIELARMSLDHAGIKPRGFGVEPVLAAVFMPVMSGGLHSSSDFVNILSNVANKSMLKGFDEVEETFDKWTGTGNLRDFKPTTKVDLGLFDSLDMVREGGEYQWGSIGDRKETAMLATYGKMFGVTRQTMVNDDLDAFSTVPNKMGRASKRTIGNMVYGLLIANPTMSDGVALFHVDHGNLLTGAGSAMSVDALDAGRTAMAKQKDKDKKAVALGIRPKFGLLPVALEGKTIQIVNSTTEPGQANPNLANRVAKMVEPIADARLDAASATAWYLAASQSQFDTIDVLYLNGQKAPTLEQANGWKVDGVEFKIRIDAAVKAWEFRTLLKANGAA